MMWRVLVSFSASWCLAWGLARSPFAGAHSCDPDDPWHAVFWQRVAVDGVDLSDVEGTELWSLTAYVLPPEYDDPRGDLWLSGYRGSGDTASAARGIPAQLRLQFVERIDELAP